jgi:hypothetical protein
MRLPFARNSLRMGAGLLVWAAHFAAIYIYVALLCARGMAQTVWLGLPLPQAGVALLTLTALAALIGIFKAAFSGRWYREAMAAHQPFISWLAVASAGFGLLGVLWCAFPALWVSACPA